MTTTTKEKPDTLGAPNTTSPAPAARANRPIIIAGLDFGTNKSCILAGAPCSNDLAVSKIMPSVVGCAKEGVVSGIITNNASLLFGEDALRHMLYVKLVSPMEKGVIAQREPARDFLKHLRDLIDPAGKSELRVVIGVPANAGEDARVNQPGYVDPVTNSLFIDIGGGTSDLCLVQGYFPTVEDQISVAFAGDAMDDILSSEIDRVYPKMDSHVTRFANSRKPTPTSGPCANRSMRRS
jgi:rod shape-determining protein MreB